MKILSRAAPLACFVALITVWSASSYSVAQVAPQEPPKPTVSDAKTADPNAALMKRCADLLAGLGLRITESSKNLISFISRGDRYNLISADDGSLLYLNIWWNIPKDKITRIPTNTLMEWNATHSTYFGMQKNDDDSMGVVMTTNFPSESVSALTLRGKIDILQQDSDAENSKLDASQWK